MPYLNAFLLEVYRTGNVIPFERRRMLKTVREGDTRVTRGMILILNYDSVNFDKNLWSAPEEFQPERFLEGGKVVNENKVLAHVAGMISQFRVSLWHSFSILHYIFRII